MKKLAIIMALIMAMLGIMTGTAMAETEDSGISVLAEGLYTEYMLENASVLDMLIPVSGVVLYENGVLNVTCYKYSSALLVRLTETAIPDSSLVIYNTEMLAMLNGEGEPPVEMSWYAGVISSVDMETISGQFTRTYGVEGDTIQDFSNGQGKIITMLLGDGTLVLYDAEMMAYMTAEGIVLPFIEPELLTDFVCVSCGGTGLCDFCEGGKCDLCGGSGATNCIMCVGAGTCFVCNGESDMVADCSFCSGTGACTSCDGVGNEVCIICEGAGGCNLCSGTGVCSICDGLGK